MPEDLPTVQLVAGAKAGDGAALAALYERYRQRLLSVVRVRMGSFLRSQMESQDLVQSVMMESLKDLGQFEYRTEGAFLHWLSTLAERKIRDKVDFHTARKRDARLAVNSDGDDASEPSHERTALQVLAQAEDVLRLERAIQELPKDQAELVVMAKMEGLSYEEIATLTGKSLAAVRKATARALARLALAMEV